MLWKVIGRIIGRTVLFAFFGTIVMAVIGACEGAITGGLLGIFMAGPGIGGRGEGMLLGAIIGGAWAGMIGAATGAISLGVAGVITSRRNDEDRVFNNVSGWAVRGSAIGVALGALSGLSTAALLGLALNGTIRGITGDYLFNGYLFGVIGGFIIGTFAGALYGALAKRFAPTIAPNRDRTEETVN
jgi:hypothetical protein